MISRLLWFPQNLDMFQFITRSWINSVRKINTFHFSQLPQLVSTSKGDSLLEGVSSTFYIYWSIVEHNRRGENFAPENLSVLRIFGQYGRNLIWVGYSIVADND